MQMLLNKLNKMNNHKSLSQQRQRLLKSQQPKNNKPVSDKFVRKIKSNFHQGVAVYQNTEKNNNTAYSITLFLITFTVFCFFLNFLLSLVLSGLSTIIFQQLLKKNNQTQITHKNTIIQYNINYLIEKYLCSGYCDNHIVENLEQIDEILKNLYQEKLSIEQKNYIYSSITEDIPKMLNYNTKLVAENPDIKQQILHSLDTIKNKMIDIKNENLRLYKNEVRTIHKIVQEKAK